MSTVVDFSQGLPSPSSIKAAGHSGIVGYLPKDGVSEVHTMTRAYYELCISAGLEVNLVYEPVDRLLPLQGRAAGLAEAAWVKAKLSALDIPARNVFVAHDIWEPLSGAQVNAARDFQRAFHDTIGSVAGAYAFAALLQAFKSDGTAGKLWLTGSESSEFPGVHLYQQNYGQVTIDGIQCDVSKVLIADHGQLPAPKTSTPPPQGDLLDMTPEQVQAAVKAALDAERESYAQRTTSYVRKNGLAGLVASEESFHNEYHGSREAQGSELQSLVADVAALKAALTAVASHLGVKA